MGGLMGRFLSGHMGGLLGEPTSGLESLWIKPNEAHGPTFLKTGLGRAWPSWA